jgi:hypothetical protein
MFVICFMIIISCSLVSVVGYVSVVSRIYHLPFYCRVIRFTVYGCTSRSLLPVDIDLNLVYLPCYFKIKVVQFISFFCCKFEG